MGGGVEMGKFIDMTGWIMAEHGVPDSRLTVIERAESYIAPCGHKSTQWICECSCAEHNKIIGTTGDIKWGRLKSCGCLAREVSRQLLLGNDYGKKNKKYNEYDLDSHEYGIGYTLKGGEFYFDKEDYDLIKDYCWSIRDGYVVTRDYKTKQQIRMHRLIMNAHPGVFIDHQNHNKNDNRKDKLRNSDVHTNHCNHEVYVNNTSGVTGVNWDADSGKWRARLWAYGKMYHFGRFDNFNDAVKARKDAEEKYFGEFSYDNSMKGVYNNELQ